MKARALLVLASLVLASCSASSPPPPAPPALPAPPVHPTAMPASSDPPPTTEGDVTVGWSRGMQILVKRTPGAEAVAAQLYIRGGVRNWTKDTAGIEAVALDVATGGGTRALAKEPYSRTLASLGASIGGTSRNDFGVITARAPRASWDALFPVFVDTFLSPALPASEFEVVKQRQLSARRHEAEDGEGRLGMLARKAVFTGHPYESRSVGTVETIRALTAEQLSPHWTKLRDTNRLVLVVVGDVDAAQVIERARAAFASVPRGDYREMPIPALHFEGAHLSGDPFKLPTNYVQSMFAAPGWRDPDFVVMRLAMVALRQRVWDEVRTKRNLSYAPSASFPVGSAASYAQLYVTTVDPATTMKVMFDETHRLQTEPIAAGELAAAKAVFLTQYLKAHERVDGQASVLGEAQLLGGDWHLAVSFPDRLRAMAPEQVRAAAAKWLTNGQTVIVGDPGKLDPKIVGAS